MKYLGIDYGMKKIGIAISDDSGTIAFPHIIVPNDSQALDVVAGVIKKEHVHEIVVGYSINQSGEANSVFAETKKFVTMLMPLILLPVHFEKEFFTSTFARQFTRGKKEQTARKTKQKNIGNVDAHAAALILQRFLDKQLMKK